MSDVVSTYGGVIVSALAAVGFMTLAVWLFLSNDPGTVGHLVAVFFDSVVA